MTTAQKPDALPVVAWLVTNLPSGEPSLCFEDERGDYGDEDHTPVFEALVLLSGAQASLLAKEAECEALRVQLAAGPLYSTRLKAKRYDWLREQSHPWGSRWLSLQELDAAIDAARAAADQGGAS